METPERQRILGAVLAGGLSRRFGSDKALADLDGETLLDRAVRWLGERCTEVVVIGRPIAAVRTLPDWPRPGLGPLGGLAAALRHADAGGYGAVLSVGVDSLGLPPDLLALLSPAPACLASQPVVGLWPASASGAVEAILQSDCRHSLYGLADVLGARLISLEHEPINVNTPEDLPPRG